MYLISNHLKKASKVSAPCLTNIWHTQIIHYIFPDNLKLADVTHVFKNENSNLAKNYGPVSVSLVVSKTSAVFEIQVLSPSAIMITRLTGIQVLTKDFTSYKIRYMSLRKTK